jgi:DNA/RNA endonuclease YhcR with UshA esterase domain
MALCEPQPGHSKWVMNKNGHFGKYTNVEGSIKKYRGNSNIAIANKIRSDFLIDIYLTFYKTYLNQKLK